MPCTKSTRTAKVVSPLFFGDSVQMLWRRVDPRPWLIMETDSGVDREVLGIVTERIEEEAVQDPITVLTVTGPALQEEMVNTVVAEGVGIGRLREIGRPTATEQETATTTEIGAEKEDTPVMQIDKEMTAEEEDLIAMLLLLVEILVEAVAGLVTGADLAINEFICLLCEGISRITTSF